MRLNRLVRDASRGWKDVNGVSKSASDLVGMPATRVDSRFSEHVQDEEVR